MSSTVDRQAKGEPPEGRNDLRFSPWNLLLLVPLLMLVTAWYNKRTPELFGLPFFYWFQFVWVFIGVACVAVVYVMTRHVGTTPDQPRLHEPVDPTDPLAGADADNSRELGR